MEPIRYFLFIILFIFSTAAAAQINDSTITFKVGGACEMCKERIEALLEVKGVRSADWNINTRILTMSYDPAIISFLKLNKILAEAGHDTGLEKAKDVVYNKLPGCCHYREIEKRESELKEELERHVFADSIKIPGQKDISIVKGVVLEENSKGLFHPLSGASVFWAGTPDGTITDSSGIFKIPTKDGYSRLVISYVGYSPDTVTIADAAEVKIILGADKQLNEVRVFARQRSTYISAMDPVRTQVMTEKELFKAACCNLSESFETNPSVDVTYNDAVTGSKQIQLLGLSGNYTQLTVENLPGPRGIVTALGLNTIAGPWVESIQLSKGVGSVVNGFESIAGQINIELKKPESAERLYANAYVNTMGKTDLNLNIIQKTGKKWSTALLLHEDFLFNSKVDFNKDGFRDLPTGNQFTLLNRWKYENDKGYVFQVGVKYLIDSRTGGQTDFDPQKHKFTTNRYGLGIHMERFDGFAKLGYVFPQKKYQSIGLQLSAFDHRQDSYFGLRSYNAGQQNFYANLIYQSIIGTTGHKFRTGLNLVSDKYNEDLDAINYDRTETVPGAFFEYTFTPAKNFNMVAGIRADHNILFGWFLTPRLHIRYEPVKGTTIRLSAGRGQRTANILAENMSVFVSARQVNILSPSFGKAYGLEPEVAWNNGISIDQKLKLFNRGAFFSVDFFRNDFDEQVIVDLENARQVKFYNLTGRSFSNSLQSELTVEPIRKFGIRLAYRFFDVKTTFDGKLLQKPFISKHRAFANLAYETGGWKFDYTLNFIGPKRIPNTSLNPDQYKRKEMSPSYILMNAQVSKEIGRKLPFEIYIGGENLANYFQEDAIIAADQPFGDYFDASLIWGPVNGRLLYAGFRYKIK